MRAGLVALLFAASGTLASAREVTLELPEGEALRYAVLEQPTAEMPSARETARRMLGHLAAGDIEEAAVLSNTPKRRYEVLRAYLSAVGEPEFKRVFSLYRDTRLVAEVAIGPRRLLIWDLAQAGSHLAGQYYVNVDGRFLVDDVPSEAREQLARVLEAYRAGRAPR